MKHIRPLAACAVVFALSGCMPPLLPDPYSPNYAGLDRLRNAPLPKVAVGSVQPRDPEAPVNIVFVRNLRMAGPKGTFAQYLEDALIQDLREISAYDANSSVRIDAVILANKIDVDGFLTGRGQMKVDIVVTRSGAEVLRKTFDADTQFDSSFFGDIAIPKGRSEYVNLVRALLRKIYVDSEFIAALKS